MLLASAACQKPIAERDIVPKIAPIIGEPSHADGGLPPDLERHFSSSSRSGQGDAFAVLPAEHGVVAAVGDDNAIEDLVGSRARTIATVNASRGDTQRVM